MMNSEHELDTYQAPNPIGVIATLVLGLVLLILTIAALFANWKSFVSLSSWLIECLVIVALVAVPSVILVLAAYKAYLLWLHIQHKQMDIQERRAEEARRQERHETDKYLAESRLHADERGNRAFIYDKRTSQVIAVDSGNFVQNVPTHYAPRWENNATTVSEEKADKPRQITGGETVIFPEPCNFVDILQSGWSPSPQGIYLLSTVQEPVAVDMRSVCHVGLGGPTGGGKTNTTRLLAGQLLTCGADMYMANINYAPVKLNDRHLEDWRPIAALLKEPPARDIETIKTLLERFMQLFQQRRNNEQVSPRRGKDIYLILCEWPAIVARWKEAPEILNMLLRESRQYGIHIISEFQDALVSTIGGSSGSRENYRTAYYFGGDQRTASVLLDLKQGQKVDETGLGKLGAVYLRADSKAARPGRVPWFPNAALYMLLGAPEDPVTDETIRDMSQVPESYLPYVVEAGRGSGVVGREGKTRVYGYQGARPQEDQDTPQNGQMRRNTGALTFPVNPPVDSLGAAPNGRPTYLQMDDIQVAQFVALYPTLGSVDKCLDRIEGCNHRHREHARVIIEERKLRKA